MITEKLNEKPWILWRLWNAFVSNGLSMGGAVTDTAVGAVMYESITHAALVDLITAEDLVPGKQYLISDFETTFTLNISGNPYTDASVEAIIVTALTDASLEPIAYSISHPNDILYYDVDGTTYMPGSTKGCIYRRIDTEKNISVPFDFREFKVEVALPFEGEYAIEDIDFPRGSFYWENNAYISLVSPNINNPLISQNYLNIGINIKMLKIFIYFSNTLTPRYSISTPSLCFNISNSYNFVINKQPTTISESLFLTYGYLKNCTFDALDNCHFNTEDDIINCHGGVIKDYILTSGTFTNNNIAGATGLITGAFNNNTFGKGFTNNYIASASGNTIAADATGNIVGENFKDNTIGLRFQNNTIGESFGYTATGKGNQIGNDFHENVIGDNFGDNTIGNWFYANTVGTDCRYNNLPFKFYSNITGDTFQNWNGQCTLNGEDFSVITLPASGVSKYIINDSTAGAMWGYYDAGTFTTSPF